MRCCSGGAAAGPPATCWAGDLWRTHSLTGHCFHFSTAFGISKIQSLFCTILQACLILQYFPAAFLLSLAPLNDHRPRGADHHMDPRLKDLFSERGFLIAVGISEPDTEATIWQTAAVVCDAGNKQPRPWDHVGQVHRLSHTSSHPKQSNKPSSPGELQEPWWKTGS